MNLFERRLNLVIGGGVFAGLLASLCCVGPLVLTLIGVSGAAVLAKFEFVRIPITLAVVAIFAFAGWKIRQSTKSCEPGSICADPQKRRIIVTSYWIGLIIAILGVTSPYWVVWIFG